MSNYASRRHKLQLGRNGRRKIGPAQELVETLILGCFLENDELGRRDRHALGFGQQAAEILVAAPPSKKGFLVAVDGFHHAEKYFSAAAIARLV